MRRDIFAWRVAFNPEDGMPVIERRLRSLFIAVTAAYAATGARALAQSALPADLRGRIDSIARAGLKSSGAPSISLAVVKDGQIVYANAYGQARLSPALAAAPTMRYSIGSVSKQITATAMLLLAEQHKLSLDDKVSRWFPSLTRANEVSIRQLLSMTSGYQDYWPQDYVMPPMLQPVTAEAIMNDWAKKPLDFDPGTKWQYSNTNYVIAGLIVEKVAGMPLVDFLRQHAFTPQAHLTPLSSLATKVRSGRPIPNATSATGSARRASRRKKDAVGCSRRASWQ